MKRVVPCRIEDAAIAAEILRQAVRRTAIAGHPIWEAEQFDAESLADRAAKGELFLCWQDGHPAATFQLMREDPLHWPSSTAPCFYVHKVAVAEHARGQGWLRDILQWTENRAREHGIKFIRLDTIAGGRLQRLYEEMGFADRGRSPANMIQPLILLERIVRTDPENAKRQE